MLENFKKLVKASQITEETAAAAEEARKDTVPQQPQVRPGSAARPATRPARPAAVRPAAKDASYDEFLEKEVGEKLAHEKAESERLDEAISENEEQLKLLLGNLTEEEAKDPGVQKLLERLGNDGAKLKKQRAGNAAPPKASKDESKKEQPPKASKDESKKEQPPKASKDESKKEQPPKAAEEPAAGSTPTKAWTIDEEVLHGEIAGKPFVMGYKQALIAATQLRKSFDAVDYCKTTADTDVNGRPVLMPDGDPITTLSRYIRDLRQSKIPSIPDFQDIVEEYATLGLCSVQIEGGAVIYRGIPVVFPKDPLQRPWALSPVTWGLGLAKITRLIGVACDIVCVDVTMRDRIITKVTRDESKNYAGDLC